MELLDILLQKVDEMQPLSICIMGSSTLPYLTHYNDIDVNIYTTDDNITQCRKSIRSLYKLPELSGYNLHVIGEWDIGKIHYPYLFYYAQWLYGDPVPQLNWLQDTVLQKETLNCWADIITHPTVAKELYHIYTMLCFLQHGDYVLSEQEKLDVNELHDLSRHSDSSIIQSWRDKIWKMFLPVAEQRGISANDILEMLTVRQYTGAILPDFTKLQ